MSAVSLPEDIEPLLTVAEACEVARISVTTFYAWRADPRLDLRKILVTLPNGRPRVPAWAWRKWLETAHRRLR